MATTPEYTKKAVNNYRKKFDVMQLRLPKGTKEIIDNKVGKVNTHNFIVQCVLNALESPQETKLKPITTEQVEEVPQNLTKEIRKEYKEPTAEEIQAMQEQINQKKAKQDRRTEELQ